MLKSLVNIIKACIISFVVCVVLAVILDFFDFSHLLQEFFIGSACSLIVVIISTIVQYKVEFKKLYTDYISAISRLIFTLSLISDFQEETPENIIDFSYESLDKDFQRFNNSESALVFFTKNKTVKEFKLNNELNILYLRFAKECESHKKAVFAAYDKDLIISAIDKYQQTWPDCYQKEEVMMIKEWLINKTEEKAITNAEDENEEDL